MPKLATSGNVKSAERWESLSARIAIAANSVAPNSMIGPMTPILKIMRILGHEAFGHNLPDLWKIEASRHSGLLGLHEPETHRAGLGEVDVRGTGFEVPRGNIIESS